MRQKRPLLPRSPDEKPAAAPRASVHDTPRPFTVSSLAERWQVSEGTIYNMVRNGTLKSFRAGKTPLRISQSEVLRHEKGDAQDDGSVG